jgi:DNA-directed RNA polymerase subunit beta'
MNRLRVSASSRDAALKAQWKKTQEALIAANSAEEERKAEAMRDPADDLGDDPLAAVEGETHGTDADAGDYLEQSDEQPVEQPADEPVEQPEEQEGGA